MNRLTRIGIGVVGSIVLFAAGLLMGREFPMHHYERFGQSPYLYDTSTGKMCNPFKISDPLAKYAVNGPGTDPLGFQVVQTSSLYPPCEK